MTCGSMKIQRNYGMESEYSWQFQEGRDGISTSISILIGCLRQDVKVESS